ncbi:hypothetical protein H1P_870006 [Hyella patelloides LEGE 07179]|uniref:Uncharacterized protein n=1 Tax=Hyella patelloides LEGE 07179 TaxID=945734 RepID=A0A563W591_9CYAN|nr:hypothetical protein [Hyella patelloides]VEP18703.1 hypothetical protein H1P_870006 [Hyella patelloides LEGE 07179]
MVASLALRLYLEEKEKQEFRSILSNAEVLVLQDYPHSSYFQENPRQMMIYVQPTNVSHWKTGICVRLDNLIPVRIRQGQEKSNKNLTRE